MAGNTSTIDLTVLRLQWDSHSAMAAICDYWAITKDQLIRLKSVAGLQPRHDRSLRHGGNQETHRDPTPREIRKACLAFQAKWDERTRQERSVIKSLPPTLRFYPDPENYCDSQSGEGEEQGFDELLD